MVACIAGAGVAVAGAAAAFKLLPGREGKAAGAVPVEAGEGGQGGEATEGRVSDPCLVPA
jgi:hypothetical protein